MNRCTYVANRATLASSFDNLFWLEGYQRGKVVAAHVKRNEQALRYLTSLPDVSSGDGQSYGTAPTNPTLEKALDLKKSSKTIPTDPCDGKDCLAVCFISAKRNKTGFDYLYQSVASFHASARRAKLQVKILIAFCGPLDDLLTHKFRYLDLSNSSGHHNSTDEKVACSRAECVKSAKERTERLHYSDVLYSLSSYHHMLILQDDAMAFPGAGNQLLYFLKHRLASIHSNQPMVVKLMVQQHLTRYPLTLFDFCELTASIYMIFVICNAGIGVSSSKSLAVCLTAIFLYFLCGRSIIYEHRRLQQWLFALKPSLPWNAPAMLYVRFNETARHLSRMLSIPSSSPVDLLIHRYSVSAGITCVTLEPNIFWHIGFESALNHVRRWAWFIDVPVYIDLD